MIFSIFVIIFGIFVSIFNNSLTGAFIKALAFSILIIFFVEEEITWVCWSSFCKIRIILSATSCSIPIPPIFEGLFKTIAVSVELRTLRINERTIFLKRFFKTSSSNSIPVSLMICSTILSASIFPCDSVFTNSDNSSAGISPPHSLIYDKALTFK